MEKKDHPTVWALCILMIFVFLFGLSRWISQYQDRHRKNVIIMGIMIVIMAHMIGTLSLYPIDVGMMWINEKNREKEGYLEKIMLLWRRRVKICYYMFYGLHIVELFVILPFVYYYYEEWNEESTNKTRIFEALRRSLFFLLLFIVLFFCGTFMSITRKTNSMLDLVYFEQTFKVEYIKTSMFFIVDVILLFGIVLFCIYTAFGFSMFPLRIIKTKSINVPTSATDIKHALILNREKQRAIEVRYTGFHTKMNVKDRRILESLQREERTLVRCIRLTEEGKRKWEQPVSAILHMFQLLIGIFFLLISIGIVLLMSMAMFIIIPRHYTHQIDQFHYNYTISNSQDIYNYTNLSNSTLLSFKIQDSPSDRLYTLTVLNTIINDITGNYDFFKTWYSYSYLLFLAVFLLSFIILSFSGKTENIQNNTEIEPERETLLSLFNRHENFITYHYNK
ncbi:hypothetical protein T552_00419 [Pneumocystis carinii B80]|uniref:Abscisic acid G-protein coupled receptor-like domain-containing protein n=1 Tax=Pneumocystis carinii (strain B80) TaxID=1408658 RepID=A0A0W4ZQQ2_PNEC8|nr:hypothetical protein T552_00419 [Pneumocystis carinii B80]KTW30707.1 hypothetical protein T552_00419 [Pneumocystis carinii B80]